MPHKFNAAHRDKIPKHKHRVTNWPEYNEGLRQRGDLTVWISEDALSLWSAPRRTTRGGQPHYSDLAIEMCLTLGLVFKQPLRQTQGLMRSIARLLGVAIAVPDFSTLSRRGNGLTFRPKPKSKSDKPVQLVMDSTGVDSGRGQDDTLRPLGTVFRRLYLPVERGVSPPRASHWTDACNSLRSWQDIGGDYFT
ncbi:Transposase DDE domain-containing protein [Sulfitobacter brevis]|uniref:Transposase DDE domain-containing protein n=1 Tax=Sulfitobacter brevis TaxID=74348 RepID=A0A1I2GBL5_9RHOB|nr:transposase [Sulfitobacter brevis]SFF15144.1 Transposase DDE domain-containing protein [Sulfitobacter brevis]